MRRLTYGQAISEATVQCMEADPSIFMAGHRRRRLQGHLRHHRRGAPALRDRARLRHPQLRERHDRHRHRGGRGGQAPAGGASAERLHVPVHGSARQPRRQVALHVRRTAPACPSSSAASWGADGGRAPRTPRACRRCSRTSPACTWATPASPADAKGLLVSALRGTGPVVLLENRALYELEGEVPEGLEPVPFGKGAVTRPGKDITIVGVSLMAYEAMRAAEILAEQGVGRGGHRPPQRAPPRRGDDPALDQEDGAPGGGRHELGALRLLRRGGGGRSREGLGVAQGAGAAGDAAGLPRAGLQAARGGVPPEAPHHRQACLDVLKAGSSAAKGVADVQATFAGPY